MTRVTTTIEIRHYNWVLKRRAQFGAILDAAIERLMKADDPLPEITQAQQEKATKVAAIEAYLRLHPESTPEEAKAALYPETPLSP